MATIKQQRVIVLIEDFMMMLEKSNDGGGADVKWWSEIAKKYGVTWPPEQKEE